MIKPRIIGRRTRDNLTYACFTKETIELQLTYYVAFLSFMEDKFECPQGTNFKTKMCMYKKALLDRNRTKLLKIKNSCHGFYSRKYSIHHNSYIAYFLVQIYHFDFTGFSCTRTPLKLLHNVQWVQLVTNC